ncbi:MAG TPA: carbohydrate ABC transporter permease [Firmicutes bacterium]|nr:carbohydrate ABC transporter permease [Bacillota bacterium]
MRKVRFNWADFIIWFVLGLFALIALYPFIYVLAGSFNDGMDYSAGGIWLFPREVTLANYSVVLMDDDFWHAFGNTVLITAVGTVCALLFTSVVAYAMSRRELRFRNFFQIANLFTMFFSGGLIPYFMIIVLLGLYDNFLVYIIPSIYSVYNMIIIQNFFKGLPEELREAAIIDGASELKIWWTIYMPLSKPVLATVALWLATGFWNSYFSTMVYTRAGDLETLQYFLMKMIKEARVDTGGMDPSLIEQTTSATISFAAIVIATIPILLVYPFIQKYFAKGIMIGSLKG